LDLFETWQQGSTVAGAAQRRPWDCVPAFELEFRRSGRLDFIRGYDAAQKIKGRKRHIVSDTGGLLVGAEVHPADVQDRDGAVLVITAIRQLFPWLRHLFADSVYNGANLRDALGKLGHWTIEIVKRAADAAGFEALPRRWVVERTLAWLS